MMRWLAMRGTEVILVANERPTLNDMAIQDVILPLLGMVCGCIFSHTNRSERE